MKKIVIQPGHINIKFNVIPELRSSTGAPGEQELNLRISNRLSEVLREKGFEVKQTDANANSDKSVTDFDWDLFLAVHGDADAAGISGGCVGFPEPSTDGATQESQRIAKSLVDVYFKETGIENRPSKITNNIKFYYMWKYLTGKTPCVLIELGEVQDAHDKVILADTERVVAGLARGICAAFNVPYDTPVPNPTPPPVTQPPSTGDFVTKDEFQALKTIVESQVTNLNDATQVINGILEKLSKIKETL